MKREKNKENMRKLIITTAMELFKQKEYQKTTIEEITKAAGVSKPTFFAYFKSKEQILYEFDLQQLKEFELNMSNLLRENGDLLINLRKDIVHMAANLHTSHMFTQNMMHLVTISEDYKKLLSEMFAIFKSVVEEVINYGQKQKRIKTDIPASDIANDIQNIYLGTLVNWVISNGADSLETLMGDTIDHYFQGISIVNRATLKTTQSNI